MKKGVKGLTLLVFSLSIIILGACGKPKMDGTYSEKSVAGAKVVLKINGDDMSLTESALGESERHEGTIDKKNNLFKFNEDGSQIKYTLKDDGDTIILDVDGQKMTLDKE